MNNILTMLYPVLNVLLVAILGIIGHAIVRDLPKVVVVIPKVVELVEAKIGLANTQALDIAYKKIWNIVSENNRLGLLENGKIAEFEKLITAKFPLLTSAEIENIRQDIAGEVNKDKGTVIKEIAPLT